MLDRLLYAPALVQLVPMRRCNLACGYCNEYDATSAPVPLAEVTGWLDRLKALGAWMVELSGGEPLLHPELDEIIRHAKRLRFGRVALITNGYLLSAARIRRLNAAGLDALQVSVDGVTPTAVTVKVLRPLRPKLEALAREARFAVNVNAVLGGAPVDEVLEVWETSRRMGFKGGVQLVHGEDGQLKLTPEGARLLARLGPQVGIRGADDYRMRLIATGRAPYRCRAGSRYLYVDEAGLVHWCSQQRGSAGIPLADYAAADLRREFHSRKPCAERCTVGCVRNASRFEEWRPQALAPDPRMLAPA